MTELQLVMRKEKYKTNHILHLLLSVITMGVWVPVWVLVAVSNWNERVKVDKELRKIKTSVRPDMENAINYNRRVIQNYQDRFTD